VAIKYGNWVWEGISTESKPARPEAENGHIFKELDTGESYTMVSGVWEYINLGLAFIKATKSGKIVTDLNGYYQVTFTTPFINDEYSIALSTYYAGTPVIAQFSNTAPGSFDINTINTRSGLAAGEITVSWLATRDYNP
jgi:hypothetical protein